MTLSAAAIREANAQLRDPLRMRFDNGTDMDVDGATRPCANCSLHVDTAYVTAKGRYEVCRLDFCSACMRAHAAMCRRPGASNNVIKALAPDDSTADSSDGNSSDSDISDISVE